MSNRLESLNSKKPSGGNKPSMKFKPKVVARKSKEERAKDAPSQIKQEEQMVKPPRGGQGMRGRGRNGRGNYAGTHLVVSGPLAAGSVSIGNANGSKLGLTQDRTFNSLTPTPEFLKNLKLKEPKIQSKEGTPLEDSDSEDDPTKINMNEEYRFIEEDTVLFPVRPVRNTTKDDLELPKDSKESTPIEDDALENKRSVSVKSEPIEEKIEQIKIHKHGLESKISQPTDDFVQEESNKLITDHQDILDILSDKFESLNTEEQQPEDKYVILQLPKLLPKYKIMNYKNNEVKSEASEKVGVKEEVDVEVNELKPEGSRGQIGFINIHQSGKITINLGNDNNLNVSKGNSTSFLQEIIVIDLDKKNQQEQDDVEMVDENGLKTKGNIHRLGVADKKIIATPII